MSDDQSTSHNHAVTSARWADGAIVYQVYPRSFYDANGDGVGDIAGVTHKLDYLKALGVNAIWLSPFYPSPMADFGYDVADYCDVDPLFGSLDDVRVLLHEAHGRDIKLMVDLVPNHTSDEYSWFVASRASKDGPYADWYIWRDAKGRDADGNPLPPNNWTGEFDGKSAWQWAEERQQFYLHSFDVRQPDLNWDNPEVREAIKNVIRFWLDMGVDGFRVDAVNFMAKDPEFRDDPVNPGYDPTQHKAYDALLHRNSRNWPAVFDRLAEMAEVLKEPPYQQASRFMVTEAYIPDADHVQGYLAYYRKMDPRVAAPFCFEGLALPWEPGPWRQFLQTFHPALAALDPNCVASYAFGNHDRSRLASRLGEPAARTAAVLLLTLPGMAFIYNGDELGMRDVDIPPESVQDPGAKGGMGRDPERTPVQWTPDTNAGFTTADHAWLPVADDYRTRNVAVEQEDENSFLRLYQRLGALRNGTPALRHGTIALLDVGNDRVLAYERVLDDQLVTVLINFAPEPSDITLTNVRGSVRLSSAGVDTGDTLPTQLAAYEGVVIQ